MAETRCGQEVSISSTEGVWEKCLSFVLSEVRSKTVRHIFSRFSAWNNRVSVVFESVRFSHPHWVVLARRGEDELVVWVPVEAVDLGQVSRHVLRRRVRLLFRENQTFPPLMHTYSSLCVSDNACVVCSLFYPRSARLHHDWTPADTGSSCSTSPETLRLETRDGEDGKKRSF